MRKIPVSWIGFQELIASDISSKVQERPGVYRLVEPHSDTAIWPFYVGQADDLQRRLLQHVSNSEENACIKRTISEKKCKFKFAYVQPQKDRDDIERTLYEHFKHSEQIRHPRCNDKVPPGELCEVNFD